jgi:GrpB-like predicted nucleotidyltransferase (UPF0157 family)
LTAENFLSEQTTPKDKIEIVNYDPAWPGLFFKEKTEIFRTLSNVPGLVLEHFGSTSVPGLAAKPILDIMIGVEGRSHWPDLIVPLQSLGYVYWYRNPNPNEMFFVKGMPPYGEKRTHHLHVYDFEGSRWKKELAFRDHLRENSEDAKRYEVLKRGLAEKFTFDREAYTQAKTEFIRGILEKNLPIE